MRIWITEETIGKVNPSQQEGFNNDYYKQFNKVSPAGGDLEGAYGR